MAISSPPHVALPDVFARAQTALTVLYDADCGVCRETARWLRRCDREGRLELLPLQSVPSCGRPALERLVADRPLGDTFHVVDETTGEVVSGGDAALAILDALPGGWLFRPWAALPTTAIAADLLYRVAARHRDRVAWLVGLRDEVPCPLEPALEAADASPVITGDGGEA